MDGQPDSQATTPPSPTNEQNDLNSQDQDSAPVPPAVKRERPVDDDDDDDEDGKSGRERRKIEIKFIPNKSRRHITFSKRKAGIMKKAYELSVLTGTQVLLLVVSETGLVYTFTTPKFQPLVTQSEGKNLIQACLNAPERGAENGDLVPMHDNGDMEQVMAQQQQQQQQAAAVAASVGVPNQQSHMGGQVPQHMNQGINRGMPQAPVPMQHGMGYMPDQPPFSYIPPIQASQPQNRYMNPQNPSSGNQ